MGLSYSIVASALWPMVAMIVAKHQIGTAYGMYVYFSSLEIKFINFWLIRTAIR